MFFGGCSSCNHVRCTKTATSYNYQFPLDHLLLNWAYLSGRPFGNSRSDLGHIADRHRRHAAAQVSMPRGEEFSASRPRPSFETRPARGTPHTLIVAERNDPGQAPIASGDMNTQSQDTRPDISASQPCLIGSSSLRCAMVCWTFLIFAGPGTALARHAQGLRGRTPVPP